MLDKANKENVEVKSQLSSKVSGASKRSTGLRKIMSDKKSVPTRISSVGNARSAVKPDKSTGYVKRMVIDSGNPRYAASKHSSFFGGLTTGQHVRNRFKVPVDAYKKMTRNQVDEQLFGPDGKMYNTLNCPKN